MKILLERFNNKWEPITESGCWIWIGAINSHGYGHLKINGSVIKSHRISFELFNGKIPDKLCVCHVCDIPSCVNPDHLFLGTKKDNYDDMINKGRGGLPNQYFITHCKNGHKLTASNVFIDKKYRKRKCKICERARRRDLYWKKKSIQNEVGRE